MKTMIIGIAGGSGSGKTTLTRSLVKNFGKDVVVIRHDDYYRGHENMTYEERSRLNYDHPDAFETELLIEHLKNLKLGIPVERPVYDYSIHNRAENIVRIEPAKVIILEGILILSDDKLRETMDIRIFVDTDADVRLIRRIRRDVHERARSLESILNQYLSTVKPMHEQYVEPSKKYADIAVFEGGYNMVALEMILNRVRSHIEKS